MNPIRSIRGLILLTRYLKVFNPEEVFRGKRIAVIGAASSAFEKDQGKYIDSFDLVVRVNKALHTWKPEHEKAVGRKTDILFHSFFENESSGGGPIQPDYFREFGLEYLVQPLNNKEGMKSQLNFYKRNLQPVESYVLSKEKYQSMMQDFEQWIPTIGYTALYSVLTAPCAEVYISGFTFFKTPYAMGYRDHLLSEEANKAHIENQGRHNPELEFQNFLQLQKQTEIEKVHYDEVLAQLVSQHQ